MMDSRFIRFLMLAALWALPLRAQLVSNVLTPYAERVDAAVVRGLDYLVASQASDGTYSTKDGKTAGIVALSGMAFLSAGYTPGYGPYTKTINQCIDRCLYAHEKYPGYMGHSASGHGKMYAHTIATLFLLEVSGMVDPERQLKLDKAIEASVKTILAAQQVEKSERDQGGWRYSPTSKDSDLSCSGWAVMALRSARLNGIPIPDSAIEDAVAYIKRHQSTSKGSFGYQNPASSSLALGGAGLLCLELLGHHGEKETFEAGRYLLSEYRKLPSHKQFIYGLYYTSQGMFQLGENYWATFAPWMYDHMIPEQEVDGSWSGDAYKTAMCILAFTVPYRQLPIYQRDETVDEEPE